MAEIDGLGSWVSQTQCPIHERVVGRTPEKMPKTGEDAGEDVGQILWVWVKLNFSFKLFNLFKIFNV
jgi:hypothetical protein